AGPPRTQAPAREELRTVSVLAAEVAVDGPGDPEERRDVTGRCLAAVIAEVEALGGTVTSVSGGGLQAMFGAPEAHEDDPERAARAAFRALSAVAAIDGGTLRIGVETGPAVLGPIGGGARVAYGAVGEVGCQAGLGKARLVQECRKRAARGTRWLGGSSASYASSTPYGLYQQLLANWAGVTPDQPAAVTGPALERALAAVRAGDLFPLLARMM